MDDVKQLVRHFIATRLCAEGVPLPADHRSLLDSNAMDSAAVLELASFLQETFAIAIRDDELTVDNIDSIDRIVAFVSRKRGEPAPAVAAAGAG